MAVRKNNLLLLFSLFLLGTLNAAPWYEGKLEGWYYFQEAESDNPTELLPEEADEILEEEKQRLKEQLSLAVLSPTIENVERYLQQQQRWIDQSSLFAQLSHQVHERSSVMHVLGKKYFLLFCFQGEDPLSENAAKSARHFASVHEWRLKGLSLDGMGLEGFEEFEVDEGLGKALNIQASPAFYVVEPISRKIVFLGAGQLTPEDIERTIELKIKEILS